MLIIKHARKALNFLLVTREDDRVCEVDTVNRKFCNAV